MKRVEITKYICSYCGTEYYNEAEAERCESFHKKPVEISKIESYDAPKKKNPNPAPKNIEVKMADGSIVKYSYSAIVAEAEDGEDDEEEDGEEGDKENEEESPNGDRRGSEDAEAVDATEETAETIDYTVYMWEAQATKEPETSVKEKEETQTAEREEEGVAAAEEDEENEEAATEEYDAEEDSAEKEQKKNTVGADIAENLENDNTKKENGEDKTEEGRVVEEDIAANIEGKKGVLSEGVRADDPPKGLSAEKLKAWEESRNIHWGEDEKWQD